MAEESGEGGSVIGLIGVMWATGKIVGQFFAKPIKAILRDGTIAAAWRQGADELGMALKAFPDSIQAYEMGTIFSPTPYEVSKGRNPDLPSSGEVARDNTPYGRKQGHDHGRDNGNDNDRGR